MYSPAHFAEQDRAVLYHLMQAHPLACIVTLGADGLVANHIPLLLRHDAQGNLSLVGHVARPNELVALAQNPLACLVIFQAAEHYISPNWYASKVEDGKVVPTWNYSVVHVNGHLHLHDDVQWLRTLLDELTNVHEASQAQPWQVADAPSAYLEANLRAIVGVEISIEKIIGKRKLSQNKSARDVLGIVAGLEAHATQHADASAMLVAQQMTDALKK